MIQWNTNQSLRAERDTALVNLQQERDKAAATPPAVVKPAMDDTELLRLRAEVSRLRGTEAELVRLKQDLMAAREDLARAQATPPTESPVPAIKDEQSKLISNMKQVGLGLRMLANKKTESEFITNGRLSPQLLELFGGTEQSVLKRFENVTLLVNDSKTFARLEREKPDQIVAHSSTAFALPDGRWTRIYVRADGSVERRQHNTAEEIWDGTAP